MRILIVGAGAVGGYFGARLSVAGRDVTYLVRPARAEQLRKTGLQIFSPHGDLKVEPNLVTADRIEAPYDLIVVSVKAYALKAAMEDFAPAVGPGSVILPLLNGMAHMEALTARFGAGPVIGGVCRVSTDVDPEGRIHQLADFQWLGYGEVNGEVTPRVRAVDAALSGAAFDTQLSSDILYVLWEKWVQLASLGGTTCLMRGPIGEIAATNDGAATALRILAEATATADANGYRPNEDFLRRQAAALTAAGSPIASSMYRDLVRGGPVEADQILGDFVARAHQHKVATPLLDAAYASLQVYQNRRAKA